LRNGACDRTASFAQLSSVELRLERP